MSSTRLLPVAALACLLGVVDPGGDSRHDGHSSHRPHLATDDPAEVELRARLDEDPNDIGAFNSLAELVRASGEQARAADPLTADAPHAEPQSADLAVWALAEELAGRPNAWYPLIELGRLSVHDDLDGALRRLGAACAREDSGLALAEAIWVLREAGQPAAADSLATAHWDSTTHVPAAGRQVVLAALESERRVAAAGLLDLVAARGDDDSVAVVAELRSVVPGASR
jgi:hypothetical protein